MPDFRTLADARAARPAVVLADDYRAEFTGPRLAAVPDQAAEAEAAFQIGQRFGRELRATYGPDVAGLPAAETLLAAADRDLLPVGHAFLDGIRLSLAVAA